MFFRKKTTARQHQVRKNINSSRTVGILRILTADNLISIGLGILFAIIASLIIIAGSNSHSKLKLVGFIIMVTFAMSCYVFIYQKKILKNHLRALTICLILLSAMTVTKIALKLSDQQSWATGAAVAVAISISLSYHRRFAVGLSLFYCVLGLLASGQINNTTLLLTMISASFTCCLLLEELRTRMKMLEVGAIAAGVAFVTPILLSNSTESISVIFIGAFWHSCTTLLVALVIQSLLPVIEKTFHITTSMTLLDYSNANQPLLKKLAMEAPGTYSHSILVGSLAEAAAEAIGRNGLLCRVGAYYHDIGKLNKPTYFTENQMDIDNRHKELSPAMSQLIITGHVKDGIAMAKEYGLPSVLRQFIETHHGTTLVEYFYNEAKQKHDEKNGSLSENEFRYAGPKPIIKEAAIVMLADAAEGAVRSLTEVTPSKIEAVTHNMAMKRLLDGQFDECDLTLKQLHAIEVAITKTLAGHCHGRIAYPTAPDQPLEGTQ